MSSYTHLQPSPTGRPHPLHDGLRVAHIDDDAGVKKIIKLKNDTSARVVNAPELTRFPNVSNLSSKFPN